MDTYRIAENVLSTIIAGRGEEYKEFFREKMKEWGIESPRDLPAEQRDEFFEEIEEDWTGEEYEEGDEPEKKASTKKANTKRGRRSR